ncbi:MAG: c-type cytochrome [Chitinophagaceae bacterium]|nr:c-type cytochrome [Chitinophagaceae bacterium]
MHLRANWFPVLIVFVFFIALLRPVAPAVPAHALQATDSADCWTGAGPNQIPVNARGDEIRYGRDLISNTAFYFGPKGTIAHSANGMNCQNCHLEAGTKPWGNNFGAVASTYPKFRERSGAIESIAKRVNDCFERSLNGKAIDTGSREMKAIIAYIRWLGDDVPKGTRPKGSGIMQPAMLDRAADPAKGSVVYTSTCARCHGKQGEGQMNANSIGFLYPPLWGTNSYNTGAGLYRLSRLAGYVRANMPNPQNYHNPELSNAQAWDLAAFINSQPRPAGDLSKDWPDISKKPFDHPFGPYADRYSETRHKYGPWEWRVNN